MKRIAIYAYHNIDKDFEDYAAFFINSLLEIANKIIVIVNKKLTINELKKIDDNRISILETQNADNNFIAYKKGFFRIGSENLKNYDELIFVDSQIYGPFYPLKELFQTMESKGLDFWGLTKKEIQNKNIIGLKSGVKDYIEPHFVVYNRNVFLNQNFREYFESFKKLKNKDEETNQFKLSFTQYFKKLGYKYGSFIDENISEYNTKAPANTIPDILISKFGLPVIKKSVFSAEYEEIQKSGCKNRVLSAFEYIKQNTQYNTNLIIKDCRNYPPDKIKKLFHLNFILSEKHREYFSQNKCAAIIGNFEENNIITEHLKGLCGLIDIYKEKELKNYKDYEFILFFTPQKTTLAKLNIFEKQEYLKHLINCAIPNRIYMTNVIKTFINNPHVGILTPIPFVFDNFKTNKEFALKNDIEDFIEKINFEIELNLNYINSISGVFWARREVFNAIDSLPENKNLNNGIMSSLIAQKEGYFTGTVSREKEASLYTDNLEYMILNRKRFKDKINELAGLIQ